MFFTQWVTRNYLLVNISMLRLENLDEWILQQMPDAEVLEFHCSFDHYKNLFPNNRGQKEKWDKFKCEYTDISFDDTYTILYKLVKKRPEKPTIAFIETRKFENTYARDRWLAENPQ